MFNKLGKSSAELRRHRNESFAVEQWWLYAADDALVYPGQASDTVLIDDLVVGRAGIILLCESEKFREWLALLLTEKFIRFAQVGPAEDKPDGFMWESVRNRGLLTCRKRHPNRSWTVHRLP